MPHCHDDSATSPIFSRIPGDSTEDELDEVNGVGVHHLVTDITSAAIRACRSAGKPEWTESDVVEICAYDADDEDLASVEDSPIDSDVSHGFGVDDLGDELVADSAHVGICEFLGELPEGFSKTFGSEEHTADLTRAGFYDFIRLPEGKFKTIAREGPFAGSEDFVTYPAENPENVDPENTFGAPTCGTTFSARRDDVWSDEDAVPTSSASGTVCGSEDESVDLVCVDGSADGHCNLSSEMRGARAVTGLRAASSSKRLLAPEEAAALLQRRWRARRTAHLEARRAALRPTLLAAPKPLAPPAGPKPSRPCRQRLADRADVGPVQAPLKLMEPQARRQICRLVAENLHGGEPAAFKLDDGDLVAGRTPGEAWPVSIAAYYDALDRDGGSSKMHHPLRPVTSRGRALPSQEDAVKATSLGAIVAPVARRVAVPPRRFSPGFWPPLEPPPALVAHRAGRFAPPSSVTDAFAAAGGSPSAMALDLGIDVPARPRAAGPPALALDLGVVSKATRPQGGRRKAAGFLPKLPPAAKAAGLAGRTAGASAGGARSSMPIF